MFGIPGARMVAVVDPDPETETVAWTVLVVDHGGDLGKIFGILDSIWDRHVVLRLSNLIYYVFLWVIPPTAVQTSHVPASFGAFHFFACEN